MDMTTIPLPARATRCLSACRAVAVWLALVSAPAGAAGAPDLAFGEDGMVVVRADREQPYGHEHARAALVDVQGRYVMAGRASTGFGDTGLLTRQLPDGTPDPSLGGVGHVYVEWFGYGVVIEAMREQPADGDLIVAGHLSKLQENQPVEQDVVVCRLMAEDGSLDTGFGFGGCRSLRAIAGRDVFYLYVSGLELLPDGDILVLGEARYDPDDPRSFALARLNANGSVDFSFGDSDCPHPAPRCGSLLSPAGLADAMTTSLQMALYPSGDRVAVAGSVPAFDRAAVLRFGTDGVLEEGTSLVHFENLTGIPGSVSPSDLLVQDDGSVTLLATVYVNGDEERFLGVARLLSGGGDDPGFGMLGRAIYTVGPTIFQSSQALAR